MHRRVPIPDQVYKRLFPYPVKERDPHSWANHVEKNLVTEIRLEVQMFYGVDKDSLLAEARFPGFDYCQPYHRMRLRRHTYHRRLFRAFDDLRLTYSEIYNLCDWEGTLIVRRRYEEQNHCKLRDTTGDEIVHRQERERLSMEKAARMRASYYVPPGQEQKAEVEMAESDDGMEDELENENEEQEEDEEGNDEDEDEDDEVEVTLSDPEDCPTNARLHLLGAVRHMHPEQYAHTRRLINPNPRVSRASTPTASVAA